MTGDTLKGPETDWRQYSTHCPHGVASWVVCNKCAETARQEAREERLYETLDKLADAVAALGLALEREAT